jgi:hypothetical protein
MASRMKAVLVPLSLVLVLEAGPADGALILLLSLVCSKARLESKQLKGRGSEVGNEPQVFNVVEFVRLLRTAATMVNSTGRAWKEPSW